MCRPQTPGGQVLAAFRWRVPQRVTSDRQPPESTSPASVHRPTGSMSGRVIHVQEVSTGAAKQRVSRLEEETIDRARCIHVPVLLRASGVGYPGGSGRGRRLAPVRGSSAALARDRGRPLPHGSPADAAGPPADTYRIRLSKEQRRLAHAVLCSSPVPLMPLPTESRRPHGVPSFVDKSTPGSRSTTDQ